MGIHIIKMPDIGEGIAEVELVAWHAQPGDDIAEDQLLAEVMTDKATVEIPSPVQGKVLALGGKVGEVMAVGSELIRIEVDGAGNVREAKPKTVSTTVPATVPTTAPASVPAPARTPGKPRMPGADAQPTTRRPGDKPLASPAVRRRAWDQGIELQFIQGSGEAGVILQEDLDAWLLAHEANGQTVKAAPRSPPANRPNDAEEAIPVIGLRRRIAQKMQESKRRIPHYSYVEEVDVTDLESLRSRLNQRWGASRGKLTVLPLLLRAMVLAVADHPSVNATYDDEAQVVTRHGAVHAGIATQTPAGLMVPVIRHAETHDLWSAAAEIVRLADAARSGKATRDELVGSTITITSLGALGGIVSTPVINHPEVAIVGVNRIVERPVVRDGAIVVRKMMNLSSSFDHRVVDGMTAAEFVQSIRSLLECPALLFID